MSIGQQFRRVQVVVVLLAIPAILLGLALLLRSEFEQVRQIRSMVDGIVETRAELSMLLSQNQDIETGTRGYAIAGMREFLEPYQRAVRQEETTLAMLDDRAAEEPELRPGVEALKALAARKRRHADSVIALVDRGDMAGARAAIASGEGKAAMDRLRVEIDRLDALEMNKLSRFTDNNAGSAIGAERLSYALLFLFGLILAFAAVFAGYAIRQRQAALARFQALNQRQQAMFDGAVDGMLVLDDKGYIRELNPSITRLFGYRHDELVGRHNTILIDDPPDIETSNAWLRQVPVAGAGRAGQRREFTGRRKDGHTFPTDVAISRFTDGGEPCYIALIRDITERKRIETMKTEFVSTVSHELRTPLTSIAGSLGLLGAGAVGPLNEKAARLITIAHSNCERLIRLINDILDIEKIESGRMEFAMQPLALAPVLEATLAAIRSFAESRDVSLRLQLPRSPVRVSGDADRLEQLVTNLVSNAIKHSPPGGTVEIELLVTEAGRARIAVRDRGTGVPPEFRDRIFGKFAQADSSDSRVRGGTGLGLSIAREIADHHGGKVDFLDRPGGGTEFFVELPLLGRLQDASVEDESLPVVLHMDDDPDCLNVVASAFAGRAAVVPAETIEDAAAIARSRKLAAAIVDVGMASHDGLELIPLLRAIDPRLPVVLFTAHDELYDGAGAAAVVVKSRAPLGTLVETVMHAIETSGSEQAA